MPAADTCRTRRNWQNAPCVAREQYAHGAWLVELARTEDPTGVAFETARALGVRERPGWTALETLCSAPRKHAWKFGRHAWRVTRTKSI